MFKSLMREVTLSIQSRTGFTTGAVVGLAVAALAAMGAVAFLCVAAYAALMLVVGSVFAGLIMAGAFLVIVLIAVLASASARRRARERAILERAARAHSGSWLLDPKILSVAVQAGRSLGWQRLLPVALLTFMAAQWARDFRGRDHGGGED